MTTFVSNLLIWVSLLFSPEEAELPQITAPEGFDVDMIYSPSENGQGSWVSLTSDDQGRLIASDQYGMIYRITLPTDNSPVKVDSISLPVGSAQGLLHTKQGLYVSVNTWDEKYKDGSGVYLLRDTNGDDTYDSQELLLALKGNGEHGPHALIKGQHPDEIYLIAGNHTLPPAGIDSYIRSDWREDRLFPALLDPRGHANDIDPPGGWVAKSSDNGESWMLIANGFRNAYDLAINREGDLFTFDSDMEWDLGTPWYRPTRVCQVIPGAEFGWRTGSGKWQAYYPDNLPGTLNVGQGSPTGITFGFSSRFPAEYQQSLYLSDWSFGTIYQVDLRLEGAGYKATKKEFLSGSPLAISDLIVHSDGNMYFTTGGRRGTSYLYRVKYTGGQSVEPISMQAPTNPSHAALNEITRNGASMEDLLEYLDSPDRTVSYSARVALENINGDEWWDTIERSSSDRVKRQGALAAIRQGYAPDKTIAVLRGLNTENYSEENWLDLIRCYALYYSRNREAEKSLPQNLPDFPVASPSINRELCELSIYLGDYSVIFPAIELMESYQMTVEADLTPKDVLARSEQYGPAIAAMHDNRPAEQALALGLSLSYAEGGWTDDSRKRYFTWFYEALSKSGGMSYGGFVEKVRLNALSRVPEEVRPQLATLSGEALLNVPAVTINVPPPVGPGRNWDLNDARKEINDDQLNGRSFARGKELFEATLCSSCHAIKGKGGNIGPDLTQAGTRFSDSDLLNAMILPSMSISDQYGATLYEMIDGSTRIGRQARSTTDSIYLLLNPYSSDETAIARTQVKSEKPSPVSLMPAGLINSLNPDELRDLMAYLKSGGNESHALYKN